MFDKLAIDLAVGGLRPEERATVRQLMPDITQLINSELVTVLSGLMASRALAPGANELKRSRQLITTGQIARERFNAAELRARGFDAVALTQPIVPAAADDPVTRERVVRIVLDHFPEPSESARWEDVKAFRDDRESREKFWRLKSWINSAARKGLKQYEVNDELFELLASYRRSIEIHKMKATKGRLEVVVTTVAEIVEDLVRLKVSGAAKSIFGAFKEEIGLLEEEAKAPGKEVAYIYSAIQRFGKPA